jgi:regulatory protein
MPVVTAIRQQQRRNDRYSVYLDGKYVLSLSEAQLAESALMVGDSLNEGQLQALHQRSEYGKATFQALNWMSYRPRSCQELERYLIGKGYDDELIAAVLAELEGEGHVDDQRFAQQWVGDRQTLGYSTVRLRQELQRKGVENEAIEAAFASSPIDEVTRLCELIKRRRLMQRYADRQKLIRHLAGKGFDFGTIKAALERLESD